MRTARKLAISCTYDDTCVAGFCKSSGKTGFGAGWYGTAAAEQARSVDQVGQEGFLLAGDTYQSTHADGYLVRTDAAGKKVWDAVLEPPHGCCGPESVGKGTYDHLFAVRATPFGSLAVGGTGLCHQRGWVVRMDPNGKVVFSKIHSPQGGAACFGTGDKGRWHDLGACRGKAKFGPLNHKLLEQAVDADCLWRETA